MSPVSFKIRANTLNTVSLFAVASQQYSDGHIWVMNILRKIMLIVAVVSACAVASVAWGEVDARTVVQPKPPAEQRTIEHKPQRSVGSGEANKNTPVAAANLRHQIGKPAGQLRTPQRDIELAPVTRKIPSGNLLTKLINSDPVEMNLQQSTLAKSEMAGSTEAADGFGLDIGNGLPLPTPDSVLIAPQDRPAGFHVGVDYSLDQKWGLTGLAGVMTTGGIVANPVKPSVNQVGVRASYRF